MSKRTDAQMLMELQEFSGQESLKGVLEKVAVDESETNYRRPGSFSSIKLKSFRLHLILEKISQREGMKMVS